MVAIPKAVQSARTREALLTKSQQLFARRGFTNTSVDDVARAVRLTKGALYWHFKSKDELLDAILERIRVRWTEAVLEPVTTEADPLSRLAKLFDGYDELFRESPDLCLFLQQVLLDDRNKASSAKVARVFSQTAKFIARIFDDGKAAGMFNPKVESAVGARVILGTLAGLTQQLKADASLNRRAAFQEAKAMALTYASITPRGRVATNARTKRNRS